jgi:hypothetical protein
MHGFDLSRFPVHLGLGAKVAMLFDVTSCIRPDGAPN